MMRGKLIKTQLARAFEADINERLAGMSELLELFKSKYDPKCHGVKYHLTVHTPPEILFTKKDRVVSQNSFDADCHKLLTDRISDAVGIDDAIFTRWYVDKVVAADGMWNMEILIETFDITELYGSSAELH